MGKFFSELIRVSWPILAGYFVNDAVEITKNVTNATPDASTGKTKWWVVGLAVFALGVVVWLGLQLINLFLPKRK